MQFHNGKQLEKIFLKRGLNVARIAKKMGLKSRQNLNYYFKVEFIKPDILKQILEAASISIDEFNGAKKDNNNELLNRITELENENKKLLLDKIALLEKLESEREVNKKSAGRTRTAV